MLARRKAILAANYRMKEDVALLRAWQDITLDALARKIKRMQTIRGASSISINTLGINRIVSQISHKRMGYDSRDVQPLSGFFGPSEARSS